MEYFVLAGGFWSQSKNSDMCGRPVDPQAPSLMRAMDYVIGIDGLPEDLLQPEGKSEILTYWCTQCNKAVPQNHVEMSFGCALNHKVETKAIIEDLWVAGVFEKYKIKKAPWIKGYRVWFDNNNGIDKWKQIYAVIDGHCRSKGIPTPMPVRISQDGNSIVLEEEIPVIKIEGKKEEKKDEKVEKEVEVKTKIVEKEVKPEKVKRRVHQYKCDKCEHTSNGYFGHYQHMLQKHSIDLKKEKNVLVNNSNTNTADSLEDKKESSLNQL